MLFLYTETYIESSFKIKKKVLIPIFACRKFFKTKLKNIIIRAVKLCSLHKNIFSGILSKKIKKNIPHMEYLVRCVLFIFVNFNK